MVAGTPFQLWSGKHEKKKSCKTLKKNVMKELCERVLRSQKREQRRFVAPQRAEAWSLEDVTPALRVGPQQQPPGKEMVVDVGRGHTSFQRCVGLFQEESTGSSWRRECDEGLLEFGMHLQITGSPWGL